METKKKHTVFVVEDDCHAINLFQDFFQELPYLVYYCSTASEAMSILTGVAPDIILCRLHLASMGDQDFFLTLQEKSPNSIRIVYSDEKDQNELMKYVALGLAQRFLCLPWEKHGVAHILSRDLITRSRIKSRKCWELLKMEKVVSPLPDMIKEVEFLLASPDYGLDRVVRVIEKDPLIVSRILKVVNSSAFPKRTEISNLGHAVTYLGVRQLREILYFLCAMHYLPATSKCRNYAVRLANESFVCSRLAAEISHSIAPHHERDAATAALLHDIGQLLLFSIACDQFIDYVNDADEQDGLTLEMEEKLFGINHSTLGSCLLMWWNLPMSIVEAAANHHYPLHELWAIPKCVAIADRILQDAMGHRDASRDMEGLVSTDQLALWQNKAATLLKEMNALF